MPTHLSVTSTFLAGEVAEPGNEGRNKETRRWVRCEYAGKAAEVGVGQAGHPAGPGRVPGICTRQHLPGPSVLVWEADHD